MINKPPKINHVDEIKDEDNNGPDEARRQLKNFHSHIFSPLEKDHEWTPKDLPHLKPHFFNSEKQDTGKRDAFYKQHGLRAPRSTDPDESPHVVANYLDHMHHHFPDIADNMNMKPMSKGTGEKEVEKGIFNYQRKKEGLFSAFKTRYGRKATDLGLAALSKIGAHDTHNKIVDKLNSNSLKKMSAAMDKFKNSGALGELDNSLKDFDKNHVKKWHSENPDLHHLSGEQAYGSFKDDFSKEHIMLRPMNQKKFTKHWNHFNGIKEEVAANCMGSGTGIATIDPLLKIAKQKLRYRVIKRWGK